MELNMKEVVKKFLYNSLFVFFGLLLYFTVIVIVSMAYYLLGMFGGLTTLALSLGLIFTVFQYCSPQPTENEDPIVSI